MVRSFKRRYFIFCLISSYCWGRMSAKVVCSCVVLMLVVFVFSTTGKEEGVWGQFGESRTGTGGWRQISKRTIFRAPAPPSGQYREAHHNVWQTLKGMTPQWALVTESYSFSSFHTVYSCGLEIPSGIGMRVVYLLRCSSYSKVSLAPGTTVEFFNCSLCLLQGQIQFAV